ncbi:hypothetical protein [Paradevosia shaoguanensis]|uniref:hypothetical protein n=1 Tax=Paradevosia shaoguanensis TaxID=1335043 RepID=UPI003C73C194
MRADLEDLREGLDPARARMDSMIVKMDGMIARLDTLPKKADYYRAMLTACFLVWGLTLVALLAAWAIVHFT